MKKNDTKTPKGLSRAAGDWFRRVAGDYAMEPHHLRVLEVACRSWDRAEQARGILDAEGLVVKDRYGQARPHPAVNIERDAQIRFMRAVRELCLDDGDPPDARPPRAGGAKY